MNLFSKIKYLSLPKKLLFTGIPLLLFGMFLNSLAESIESKKNQHSWNQIYPGKTSDSQLLKIRGEPIETSKEGLNTIYKYPSDNQYYFNEIYSYESTISFVRERFVDKKNRSLKDHTKDLKTKPVVLYGPDTASGDYLFTYHNEGVAFLANKNIDMIFEAWYFPPQELSSLLSTPSFEPYHTNKKFISH